MAVEIIKHGDLSKVDRGYVFIPDDLKTILRDYCDNDFCPNCGADMRGE